MVGLGALPLAWVGFSWQAILVRACLLSSMGLLNWCVHKKPTPYKDWVEELSRGALISLTLPL
jgi:hypothetical protein